MTVTVHRLFDAAFRETALTGEGARLFGSRWNSAGIPMIYTADSIALALFERLVHAEDPEVLRDCLLVTIALDERQIVTLDRSQLPQDWKSYAPPKAMQALGDDWILHQKSLALRVPSIIVEQEHNILINPEHAEFQHVKISPARKFDLDERLWKQN